MTAATTMPACRRVGSQMRGSAAFAATFSVADGCVVEHKAPQIIAIEPGHDGWVVGDEPVVIIEFDFEGDTVRRTGMLSEHHH